MIAVISDIHGNLEALNRALSLINKRHVTELYICGDIVGYGTQSNECCEVVKNLNCVVIAGNHDWAVSGNLDYSDFSHEAKESTDRTQKIVSEENKEWLRSLPLTYQIQELSFVHATLSSPEKFYYPMIGMFVFEPWEDIKKTFEEMTKIESKVCFVGHTHQPGVFIERSGKICYQDSSQKIHINSFKSVVDVGSVGYPRSASKKGCVVFYDQEQDIVEFVRFKLSKIITQPVKAWAW